MFSLLIFVISPAITNAKLQNIIIICKFLYLGVDLIGPLKEYEGKQYIATAVDYFTKFVEAKVISNKTAEEVGTFIYELFFW